MKNSATKEGDDKRTMSPLSPEQYQAWMKMRTKTMAIFILQTILIGMDCSLTFLTLYLYLKEQIKTNSLQIYYSIISVSFFLPCITLNGFVGHFADRYRNIRLMFFVINTFVIIGNLLYTIPYPWLLIVGRLLSGSGALLRSVIVGEVARSYHPEILSKRMSFIGVSYGTGFLVGPASNAIFANFDITIGPWRLSYYNIPGVYMAVLFGIVQIMSIFMLSNLSKVYDLKKEEHENIGKNVGNTSGEMSLEQKRAPLTTMNALKKMFSKYDIALIFLLAFLVNYLDLSFYMWNPLLIVERIKWPITVLGWIITGEGILAILTCLCFMWFTVTNKFIYYTMVLIPLALASLQAITLVFFYSPSNTTLNIVLWVLHCILYISVYASSEVVLVTIIAKLVSSNHQVFADGIRLTISRCGAVFALSISAFIYKRMDIVAGVHITVALLIFALLVFRKKTLGNPTIQIT